jgi:hypothetical protein
MILSGTPSFESFERLTHTTLWIAKLQNGEEMQSTVHMSFGIDILDLLQALTLCGFHTLLLQNFQIVGFSDF